RPVPEHNLINRLGVLEIDLPPGVLLGFGVRDRLLVELAVGLAVDRELGRAVVVGAALSRLALEGDILLAPEDLHLRERKDPIGPGKRDADVAARWPGGRGGNNLRRHA